MNCKYCFKPLERDDDGDRYYYQCQDINCIYWENGHNENIDKIAEGIREYLQDIPLMKYTEIRQALLIVAKGYENRIKPYNEGIW